MNGGTFRLELRSIDGERKETEGGIMFILLVRGTLRVEAGGEPVIMQPDGVLVANGEDCCRIIGDGGNLALCLFVSNRFIYRNAPEMQGDRYDCNSQEKMADSAVKSARFFDLKKGLTRMLLAYYRREEGYMLEVRHALMGLLHELHTNFRSAPAEALQGGESVQRAVTYIHRHFRDNFTLDELAMAENMSPQNFSKKFKQKMGVGFLEYVNGVRLKNAAYELRQTNDTMLRIAVNNGFANARAFDGVFRKNYGMSPKEYRMENGGYSREGIECDEFGMGFDSDENMREMLEYIVINDMQNGGFRNICKKEVDLSACNATPFSLPQKIFKIGRMCELLDYRIRRQVEQAQKKLHGGYIYFKGVFDDGLGEYHEKSLYRGVDHENIFAFLRETGLVPFVRIDVSHAAKTTGGCLLALDGFVDAMRRFLPRESLERSLFEIVTSDPDDAPLLMERYAAIYRQLKCFSERIRVGIHSVDSSDGAEFERFEEHLIVAKKQGCEPDFATVAIDPLSEGEPSMSSDSPRINFKNYAASQLERIWHTIHDSGSSLCEVFVTEWNTLSGLAALESASFFRNALMASDLIRFSGGVAGVAYWLNTASKELLTGEPESRAVGLFLFDSVPRPLYHLLNQMDKLGSNALHSDDSVLATKNDDEGYTIMLMNPRYFNPAYSFDAVYEEMESVRIEVTLKGLPPGRYSFKIFTLEKRHCRVFECLAKAGTACLRDEDVREYITQSVCPDFACFNVSIDGDYTISQRLTYNAAAVCEIKRERD